MIVANLNFDLCLSFSIEYVYRIDISRFALLSSKLLLLYLTGWML